MGNKKENNNSILKKNKVSQEKIDNFELTSHLVDFLWNEPFYSRILRSLNKIESTTIPTAGVSTHESEITLWWNREFLAGLPKKHIGGLLKHECLHLVFGHTTERRRDPHIIWNYGTDLAKDRSNSSGVTTTSDFLTKSVNSIAASLPIKPIAVL